MCVLCLCVYVKGRALRLIIDVEVSMMTKENDKVDHDSQDLGAAGAD